MKQTAFKKNGEYIPCLKDSVARTKYVRIMKQTACSRGKNGEYIPCLKYSVARTKYL